MSQVDSEHCLTLGACLFDVSRGLLLRNGAPVPLRPKAFALLAHLAENAGRVIGKSELMEAVWPGLYVTEDSLTQAVRELRKALAEDGEGSIRTIARRGYLLAPPATKEELSQGQPAVAVLRFTNEGSASDEPVVDGFTEDIMHVLARFGRIAVLARNSSFAFSSASASDWQAVGRQLGAAYLVRGRMRLAADALDAKISLIDAATGMVLWSESFSASGAGIFEARDEIAIEIVNRLVTRFDDASLARSTARPPTSLAAYELVLRGMARFRGYRDEDNIAAKELFELAAAKDPNYALAHAYAALVDLAMAGYSEAPPDVLAAIVTRANHALSLAPEDPRCHRILATTRLHAREHEAAEYHFRLSVKLNPYDADTMAQMGYLLAMRGRPFEALAWLDRAIQVNPIHPQWYHYDRGMALYSAGEYEKAAESFLKLPTRTPWRLMRLSACYAQLGKPDMARPIVAEIRRIAPDFSPLDFARRGVAFEHAADIEHIVEGITKAMAA